MNDTNDGPQTMNAAHSQRPAHEHYQWRLYTVAAAGASFFAGMLFNNWLERRIRSGAAAIHRPTDVGVER